MSEDSAVPSASSVARLIGGLVLLQMVGALMLPYILLNQVVLSSEFLEGAARNPMYLRVPALLFLFGAAVALAISIAAYPVVRQSRPRLAICLLALAVANVPLQVGESGMVLSMMSLGRRYAEAGGSDVAMLQGVAAAAYGARRWAHYLQLFTVVTWIFVLFASLGRAGLIPRALMAAGLLATALQIVGVPLRALLGYPVVMEMAMPLAPVYAGLGLWLLVKGFSQRAELSADRLEEIDARL